MRLVPLFAILALVLVGAAAGASPNGNGVVAYRAADGQIWTVDPSSGETQQLTENLMAGFVPFQWSPDGTRLLYTGPAPGGEAQGRQAPYVMNADGSDQHLLVDDIGHFWDAVCWFSSDLVVLKQVSLDLQSGDFYLVRADGTHLEALTTDGTHAVSQGICDPGAGRLYFYDGSPTTPNYKWISPTSRTPTEIPVQAFGLWPSPDGHYLAWFDNTHDFYVSDPDGLHAVRLATPAPAIGIVAWTPDSTAVAFQGAGSGEIELVAPNGAEQGRVSLPPYAGFTGWSPDGGKILFNALGSPWVMNADGTCRERFPDGAWQPVPGKPPDPPFACADVGVSGDATTGPVTIQAPQDYGFDVENDGNLPATDVHVAFTDLASVELRALHSPRGTCDASSCSLGTIVPGDSVRLIVEFVGTNSDFPSYANGQLTIHVTSAEPDRDDANDSLVVRMRAYGCGILGGPGPDLFFGTSDDDSFCTLTGADRLIGRGGNDQLAGGPGADYLDGGSGHDILDAGGENDVVQADDGHRDEVDCGGAEDVAIVDRHDEVQACEHVVRPRIVCHELAPIRGGGPLNGTPRNDALCGVYGNDTLRGLAGNDALDGGPGNDTLDGGPGRDLIYGGTGYDFVLARDGERDTIDCGKNYDTVIADRLDHVAKDCEHLLRGRP